MPSELASSTAAFNSASVRTASFVISPFGLKENTPVVVIFGSEIEIRALHDKGQKSYTPLLDWLAREGIPTIDVTDSLAQQAGRSGTDKVIVNHYRPLGNKIVGLTLSYRLPALTRATCGSPS